MKSDVKVLRKLAYDYFNLAYGDKNAEKLKLHKAVNDLKQIRPVVLIDEIPWNEMHIGDELKTQCSDPFLREIEWFLRSNLYRSKYMPADTVYRPFIPVTKVFSFTDIGLSIDEETIATDKTNHIVSHTFTDVLQTDEDLDKLHPPVITHDSEESLRRFNMIGEILGDIIPVRLTGWEAFFTTPWDEIVRYRSVTNLMIDLIERPDFMHKIAQKFTEISLSVLDQLEALDMFDHDPYSLHCTAARTDDLPGKSFDGERLTRKNIWGRGAAQIFGSVSKEMHDEFDIDYMVKTIGQCGLAYYGCCEPLDKKIDIVEKIPNLRKISITPWADVNVAAEAIQNKYVLASKPTPASVAIPVLDQEQLRKELGTILDACKRNNCSTDIVLKDISTCCYRPQNLFEWEKIAMEMVTNF